MATDNNSLEATNNFRPTTLKGQTVRLVPLSLDHDEDLATAVLDGELWKLWYTNIPEPEHMQAEIKRRLALQEAGSMIPFTVIENATGKAVGMTTYTNIDPVSPRVEIGGTWYAQRVQRTAVNTESKFLLLAHAFDSLACIAVELRTHIMNEPSRRAIERLGAKLDGILRSHSYARNGTLRDTCVYSIVRSEWPSVRDTLTRYLTNPCSNQSPH